jgi:hypothetical protein
MSEKYVIACGDEGVQLNEGKRLGFVGAGFQLEGFSEVIKALKNVVGDTIYIVASEENDWTKQQLNLGNWEQVNASAQQHIQVLADRESLQYAGSLPFADPKQLGEGIRGHMVRPHGIHIANKICFTLAGGEQTYNLGNFVISAEWVSQVPKELVKQVITQQVEFYKSLVGGNELMMLVEEAGELGEELAAKNKAVLVELGFISE